MGGGLAQLVERATSSEEVEGGISGRPLPTERVGVSIM